MPIAGFLAETISALLKNNLPGIAQTVLDKGVEYVEEKTGISLSPSLSPEVVASLKEAELRHEEFRITADNQNTADARDMQKQALLQDDIFSKRFVPYLATAWSFCAVIYIFCISFLPVPEQSLRFVDTVLGFMLGTIIATIINFFFGSSSSSRSKDSVNQQALSLLTQQRKAP